MCISSTRDPEAFKIEAVKQITEGRVASRHGGARYLEKSRNLRGQTVRLKYAFMREHARIFRLRSLRRVFGLQRRGYYAWRAAPRSDRTRENVRVIGRITRDLCDLGEAGSKHRVARRSILKLGAQSLGLDMTAAALVADIEARMPAAAARKNDTTTFNVQPATVYRCLENPVV